MNRIFSKILGLALTIGLLCGLGATKAAAAGSPNKNTYIEYFTATPNPVSVKGVLKLEAQLKYKDPKTRKIKPLANKTLTLSSPTYSGRILAQAQTDDNGVVQYFIRPAPLPPNKAYQNVTFTVSFPREYEYQPVNRSVRVTVTR